MTADPSSRARRSSESERGAIVSIEAVFDRTAEDAVRAEWHALASAGFSSLAAHTAASNRPHVTIAARGDGTLERVVSSGWDRFLPLRVAVDAPVLFGSGERRVLARSIVVSESLLALHRAVHDVESGRDEPFTAPGEWMPHVTLARRLRLDSLAAALPLLGSTIDAHIVGLRRWNPTDGTVELIAGSDG